VVESSSASELTGEMLASWVVRWHCSGCSPRQETKLTEGRNEVSELVVIRCSMKRFRVASNVIGAGLCSVGALVLGIAGDAVGRGQVVPWLLSVLFFGFLPVGYLRSTRIVVDADHVYVHTFGQRTTTMRREEISAIRRPRPRWGWYLHFVNRENKVIGVMRKAFSSAQIDKLCAVLDIRLALNS
jgi:hypothetical protein